MISLVIPGNTKKTNFITLQCIINFVSPRMITHYILWMMSYSQPLCLIIFLLSSFPVDTATALDSNTVTNSTKCFNRTSGPTEHQIENTVCATMATTDSKIWTWLESEMQCINTGGHLITITNDTENILIKALIEGKSCWIGLIDAGCPTASVFDWKWINGDYSTYRHWDNQEPNNLHSECCTEMWHSDGNWNNAPCNHKLNCFICEQVTEIHPTTSTTTGPVTSTRTSTTTAMTSSTPQTTPMLPVTDTLVSNGGDIALIILACVFFLIIIGLTVVIFKLKCKLVRFLRTVHNESTNEGAPTAVSNDAYGITAPKHNVDAMYYDTQNEAVESRSHTSELENEGTEEANTTASDNQFANNDVYA